MPKAADAQLLPAPDETRAVVAGLVARYRRDQDVYSSPSYKETQARVEFIDPFFEALGESGDSIPISASPCPVVARMWRKLAWPAEVVWPEVAVGIRWPGAEALWRSRWGEARWLKPTAHAARFWPNAGVNSTGSIHSARGGHHARHHEHRQALEDVMKVTYDPEVDVLRILFSAAPIAESDEDKPGVILDYDAEGNIVGLEILDASTRVDDPRGVEYAVAAEQPA